MPCSCIPPPASLKPRKIYNLLVPDVFDSSTVPDIAQPTGTNTLRKISKLAEYVSKNPAKAGKVSRRLNRRTKKALYDRQLGYVRVAVDAYCCLLKTSAEEGSTFTFSYFNKELIHQPDALISTLLSYQRPEVKALGADLLAAYVRVQSPVEHQAQAVAELVAIVLKLCTSTGPSGSIPATPMDASTAGTPADQLRQSCLTVLAEYVGFCQRLKILPQLLEQIEVSLLDSLEHDLSAGIGIQSRMLPGSNGPSSKAGDILGNFKPFLQDTSSVRRVVGALLQWLDKNQRWENAQLVQELVGLVHDACGGLTYPLTSSLLRHCANEPSLTPRQRAMVARLAVKQGAVYSLSAFNLALLELPRALAAAYRGPSAPPEDLRELHTAAAEVCVCLAREVGHAGQVCEAMATVLRGQLVPVTDAAAVASTAGTTNGAQLKQWTLECCQAVAEKLHTLPEEARHLTGRVLPPALLSALTAAVSPGSGHKRRASAASAGAVGEASAGNGAPAVRGLAVRVLAALLPNVDGPLKDDRQAAQLLAIVLASASGTENAALLLPIEVAACSSLVRAALGCTRPTVLLQAARTGLSLGQHAAALVTGSVEATGGAVGAAAAAQPLAGAAVMTLAESIMLQLAAVAQCPPLSRLRVAFLPSLPELAPASDQTLTSTFISWSPASEAAAQQAALALGPAVRPWRAACIEALLQEGVLHTHSDNALQQLLDQPLPSPHSHQPSSGGSAGPQVTVTTHDAAGTATTHTVDAGGVPGASRPSASSGGSWMSRQVSIRKERLNIARVMDILGGDEEEEVAEGAQPPAETAGAVDVVDVALRSKPGVPLVPLNGGQGVISMRSLHDVLRLAAAEAAGAEAAAAAGKPYSMMHERQLVAQLQPLAC